MADTNCATKVLASLMNDKLGEIVSKEEADNDTDPKSKFYYVGVNMGSAGVMYIKRPRQPPHVVITV